MAEPKESRTSIGIAFIQALRSPCVLCFIVLELVVIIVMNWVLQLSVVISGSMEPTIMTGDLVVYDRLAYHFREVERGDIIVFDYDGGSVSKRVVAIAGDKVSFREGYLYLNDQLADEKYLPETERGLTYSDKTFVVPEDGVFVLGDNRYYSFDSRYFDYPFVFLKDISGCYLGTIPLPAF